MARRLLVIIDMQNDFITGSLANPDAEQITKAISDYIEIFNGEIAVTKDTHHENYAITQEGKKLPIEHCIRGTDGWNLNKDIQKVLDEKGSYIVFNKPTFGSIELAQYIKDNNFIEVQLVGTCTDICVISNALLIKAFSPETKISVMKDLCAGTTPEAHNSALEVMKSCQIEIM